MNFHSVFSLFVLWVQLLTNCDCTLLLPLIRHRDVVFLLFTLFFLVFFYGFFEYCYGFFEYCSSCFYLRCLANCRLPDAIWSLVFSWALLIFVSFCPEQNTTWLDQKLICFLVDVTWGFFELHSVNRNLFIFVSFYPAQSTTWLDIKFICFWYLSRGFIGKNISR